jgi:Zn-dependent protease with chaperone function
MKTFIVMAPPEFEDIAGDPRQTDRLQFVPDRFSVPAFLFSLLWLLAYRMWLVLLGYLALTLVLELLALSVSQEIVGVVALMVALLFALEAQALRRWSLERKGWRVVGIVDAGSREDAELRFLHKAADRLSPARLRQDRDRPARAPIVPRIGSEQVVGLTLGPETRQ